MGIFAVSNVQGGGAIRLPSGGLDKLAHLFAYAVLGALLCLSFRAEGFQPLTALGLGLPLIALYGGFDEWYQSLIPLRITSFHDWLADFAGGAMGSLASLWGQRFLPARLLAEGRDQGSD